ALPYLDLNDRGMYLVDDAIRTNDTRLIAAALGPYATEHLPDAAYDQAVLKCVFVGDPITGLDGIPERVTPDGARMLGAFVHERVAAGRDVPAEVWTVIDRYPPHEEIAAIEAERESEFEDRRGAAERALSHRIQERA
ncbi:MAG TPA: EboA domain-containing protein, partial [Solirubrobacter sp.]|nr:EboA domain-containing protein [Solirubrobacter sp.]